MSSDKVKTAASEAENQLAGKGRVLIRASGTENVIRVMVEAESEELCNDTAERLADVVRIQSNI